MDNENLKKLTFSHKDYIQESDLNLFDFYLVKENINIACFGVEDNISKIEIKQFLDFVKNMIKKFLFIVLIKLRTNL
jgi:hypothetical protein